MLPVYEIASELCGCDGGPSDEEKRSAYRCLKRLQKRGLVRGHLTWLRDIGMATVWCSQRAPTRTRLDPGR